MSSHFSHTLPLKRVPKGKGGGAISLKQKNEKEKKGRTAFTPFSTRLWEALEEREGKKGGMCGATRAVATKEEGKGSGGNHSTFFCLWLDEAKGEKGKVPDLFQLPWKMRKKRKSHRSPRFSTVTFRIW